MSSFQVCTNLKGGFIKFNSMADRDGFASNTLAADSELRMHAFIGASQPTIVFEELTTSQIDKIKNVIGSSAMWFDDVSFEPQL